MKLMCCRTFTGAWIETFRYKKSFDNGRSHLYGCVNWNTMELDEKFCDVSRTFTGAWIETTLESQIWDIGEVAPLRVRELKPEGKLLRGNDDSRTFTGAWIETVEYDKKQKKLLSHLYGCVNWNLPLFQMKKQIKSRTFTGAWIETQIPTIRQLQKHRRTFTGAWIET